MSLDPRQQQHYARMAEAIAYIQQHQQAQPSLAEIAAHVHLSPDHFQRMFSQWVGTSPKKFLQYLTLAHAKQTIQQQVFAQSQSSSQAFAQSSNQNLHQSAAVQSLLDSSYAVGLSSSSRLHELFVQIEGMTPAQYKQGGKGLEIYYDFYCSPFGALLLAATTRGICAMSFYQDELSAVAELSASFPHAQLLRENHPFHVQAMAIFDPSHDLTQIKLHLKGSAFQLKVWQCLLNIPAGQLSSYGAIATQLGQASASRAVGTAIGRNPVAFLIPCHRVIRATGHLGGYRWGLARKQAMLAWEAARSEEIDQA